MLLRAAPAALDVTAEPLDEKGLVPRSSAAPCAEPQPVRSRRNLNWPTAAGRQVQMSAMPASALLWTGISDVFFSFFPLAKKGCICWTYPDKASCT